MQNLQQYRSVKARIRLPAGGDPGRAITVTGGVSNEPSYANAIPAKEWSIVDDMLNVSDCAAFTVANIDGENAGKFYPGQLVVIDESDPDVANGQWCRQFTGRVTSIDSGSDLSGGSVILVTAMDLGWHLTSCCAEPLTQTNHITLKQLVQLLIDPTWGFQSTVVKGQADVSVGNLLNRSLKQGRQGVLRSQPHDPTQILPYIQVEIGQTPWEILKLYFERTGYMINVGAKGDLVVFQPDYQQPAPYEALQFHGSGDVRRKKNNVQGHPSLRQSIDGVYSESQCWSTIVIPNIAQQAAIANNPNAQYLDIRYIPNTNPLPFNRILAFLDGEAINESMRQTRAIFRYQYDAFNSWEYSVEVLGHSSQGTFFASDTMIPVDDSVNGVKNGNYYVQRVQKTMREREGARTHLTIRKPNLLNPGLQAQVGGGGAGFVTGPPVVK